MATTTTNYGLTKPEGSDFYDIGVQNDNMDIIDKQMKANAKDIAQLNSDKSIVIKVILRGIDNKMIYWQRYQSEIAKALGMQVADINDEKLYIAACNW